MLLHSCTKLRRHNTGHSKSTPCGIPRPYLSPIVTDAIRLWKRGRNRLRATASFLLKDFTSLARYHALCQYAVEIGVLAYK